MQTNDLFEAVHEPLPPDNPSPGVEPKTKPNEEPEVEPDALPTEEPGIQPSTKPKKKEDDDDDDDDDYEPYSDPAISDDPDEIRRKTTIM